MDLEECMFDAIVERARVLRCGTRLALWHHISEGAAHPGDIARSLGLAASTVSFHLTILERAGLVCHTRLGRYRLYETTGVRWGVIRLTDRDDVNVKQAAADQVTGRSPFTQ